MARQPEVPATKWKRNKKEKDNERKSDRVSLSRPRLVNAFNKPISFGFIFGVFPQVLCRFYSLRYFASILFLFRFFGLFHFSILDFSGTFSDVLLVKPWRGLVLPGFVRVYRVFFWLRLDGCHFLKKILTSFSQFRQYRMRRIRQRHRRAGRGVTGGPWRRSRGFYRVFTEFFLCVCVCCEFVFVSLARHLGFFFFSSFCSARL